MVLNCKDCPFAVRVGRRALDCTATHVLRLVDADETASKTCWEHLIRAFNSEKDYNWHFINNPNQYWSPGVNKQAISAFRSFFCQTSSSEDFVYKTNHCLRNFDLVLYVKQSTYAIYDCKKKKDVICCDPDTNMAVVFWPGRKERIKINGAGQIMELGIKYRRYTSNLFSDWGIG